MVSWIWITVSNAVTISQVPLIPLRISGFSSFTAKIQVDQAALGIFDITFIINKNSVVSSNVTVDKALVMKKLNMVNNGKKMCRATGTMGSHCKFSFHKFDLLPVRRSPKVILAILSMTFRFGIVIAFKLQNYFAVTKRQVHIWTSIAFAKASIIDSNDLLRQ